MTREVTKPIAAVLLTRRVIGYSATAVPMPASAVMTSNQLPQSTGVLLPWPVMKPSGSSTRFANSFSCGMEAAKVSRYSRPPARAILRIGVHARACGGLLGGGRCRCRG